MSDEPWANDPRYDEWSTKVTRRESALGEVALVQYANGELQTWTRLTFEDAVESPWRLVD